MGATTFGLTRHCFPHTEKVLSIFLYAAIEITFCPTHKGTSRSKLIKNNPI